MPESAQQRYSRELNDNQNGRLRKSNAAFHSHLPDQQAHLHALWQQQQAHTSVAPPAPAVPLDYAPVFWTLIFMFVLPGWLVLAITFRVLQKRQARRKTPIGIPARSYRAAPSLLTPTEAHFYQTLREAVGPLAVIQCKVRLADLLIAPPHDFAAFRRVSQKHVDFVLCERYTLKPLVAVELDDSSHKQASRVARDHFVDAAYASADLPLVHMPVRPSYSSAEMLTEFQKFLV